jgi:hypothetical protein
MHSELVAMFPAVVYHSSLANVRKMTALRPRTCIVKLYLQASRRVIAIRYHERARQLGLTFAMRLCNTSETAECD